MPRIQNSLDNATLALTIAAVPFNEETVRELNECLRLARLGVPLRLIYPRLIVSGISRRVFDHAILLNTSNKHGVRFAIERAFKKVGGEVVADAQDAKELVRNLVKVWKKACEHSVTLDIRACDAHQTAALQGIYVRLDERGVPRDLFDKTTAYLLHNRV